MKYSEVRIGLKVLALRPLNTEWKMVRIIGKSYSTIFGGVITIEDEDSETFTYNRRGGEPFPWLKKPTKAKP